VPAMRQAVAPKHLPHQRVEILQVNNRADRYKSLPVLLRS
jgi:hypothetical protein